MQILEDFGVNGHRPFDFVHLAFYDKRRNGCDLYMILLCDLKCGNQGCIDQSLCI